MDKTAVGLGYAGLLPFAALTFAALTGHDDGQILQYFLVYSAVVLSFLGGIHWGIAMHQNNDQAARQMAGCMLPSMAAWIALTLEPLISVIVLLASYVVWWVYDRKVIDTEWYRTMRARLTAAVAIIHLIWIVLLV